MQKSLFYGVKDFFFLPVRVLLFNGGSFEPISGMIQCHPNLQLLLRGHLAVDFSLSGVHKSNR